MNLTLCAVQIGKRFRFQWIVFSLSLPLSLSLFGRSLEQKISDFANFYPRTCTINEYLLCATHTQNNPLCRWSLFSWGVCVPMCVWLNFFCHGSVLFSSSSLTYCYRIRGCCFEYAQSPFQMVFGLFCLSTAFVCVCFFSFPISSVAIILRRCYF